MIDGTIARRTNSQSNFGEKLDSVSDVCFFAASAVKVFPLVKGGKMSHTFCLRRSCAEACKHNLRCGEI